MQVVIYHNPRCSKSRQALALLRERGIEPEIVQYLEHPPDRTRLGEILGMLGLKPGNLLRTGEETWRMLGLDIDRLADGDLIQAMIENPILIERPIVVAGKKAVLGRPPEKVLSILEGDSA